MQNSKKYELQRFDRTLRDRLVIKVKSPISNTLCHPLASKHAAAMEVPSSAYAKRQRKKRKEHDDEEAARESAAGLEEVRRVFFFGLPHPCTTKRPVKDRGHVVCQPQHTQSGNTARVSVARADATQMAAGVCLFQ